MTETPEKPAAKPKKKARKRQVRTKPEAAEAASFPGLTETDCAKTCSVAGCVISGNSTCAHPRKGGLRGPDMSNPDALKRLQAAQKQLAVGAASRRFA